MAPPDLKKLLAVKIKPRQDSYTDQFSRILMVKLLMLTAAVTGISWLKDKVSCIVPKNHDASAGFIGKACWINGFYIYQNIPEESQSYYYGIPRNILEDGVNPYGSLCATRAQNGRINDNCTPMTKTFFLQYQWFPIIIAAIAYFYYLPYLLFRLVNKDMAGIKEMIKGKKVEEVKYDVLIPKYFSREVTSTTTLHLRVLLNILVKLLYVIANLFGMLFVDSTLNDKYMGYGTRWSEWTAKSNEKMHDYTDTSSRKPGHQLLPGFGLCQVLTSAKDIKTSVTNTHTYICELSQHVLYQYILIVMWYMFILGIIVSLVGLIKHIITNVTAHCCMDGETTQVKHVMRKLTPREKEYLHFIKKKSLPVYGELLARLQERDEQTSSSGSNRSSYSPMQAEKEAMMMS